MDPLLRKKGMSTPELADGEEYRETPPRIGVAIKRDSRPRIGH
jgi:hypothetical protein